MFQKKCTLETFILIYIYILFINTKTIYPFILNSIAPFSNILERSSTRLDCEIIYIYIGEVSTLFFLLLFLKSITHTIRVFELCLNEDRNYNAKINAKRCTFTIVISLSTSIVDLIINNHSRSGTIYFDIKQILDWKIIFIIPWVVSSFVTIGKNIKFFMTRIVLIDFVEIFHLFCTFHLKNNKKKGK